MQGKPRSGNPGNNTLCRSQQKCYTLHWKRAGIIAGELPGNTKKLPVQPETRCTVNLARSPASANKAVSNCNRTCFCTTKVRASLLHAKAVYLSLRRMYSGGMCGSPRLLHRGFQLFRGLMMGRAGWSTIARVVSTTIRKPRTKRTAGEAKRDGKKWETQKAVCINSTVSLLHFTKHSPSHTKPTFSNLHIHYMGFCFSPCWSGACSQGGKKFSALVAEGDRTKDDACKPHFHFYCFTVLSLMDKGLVCAQHLHRGMALRQDLNCPCVQPLANF